MFKDISIKGKILILSLITIIAVSVAIAIASIYSIKEFSNKNIERRGRKRDGFYILNSSF